MKVEEAGKRLLRSWRINVLLALLVISLLAVMNIIPVNPDKSIGFGNGLDFGMDFAGGIQIQLKLERPLDRNTLDLEKSILLSRLNALGLKDVKVMAWGDQYILVELSKASPSEIKRIENILKKSAKFEQRIDGELVAKGDEIQVNSDPRKSFVSPQGSERGYYWQIGIKLTGDAPARFGKVAYGKFFGRDNPLNRPVDLFIDRPENTTIIMSVSTYEILKEMKGSGQGDPLYAGNTAIEIIENRSRIPVLVYDGNLSSLLMKLDLYRSKGFFRVIIADSKKLVPEKVRGAIEEKGFITERKERGNMSYEDWIRSLTGLKSSLRLNFNTGGRPVYDALITGRAPTYEEAKEEFKMHRIWLGSGNLPARAYIVSKLEVPPSLGEKFLKEAFLIGVFALLTVALIVFLRYKAAVIVLPIIFTGLSEIFLILGFAAIISWELDLAAIAGIITAVGTGVDDQIVITDETLRREKSRRLIPIAERIKRAFFIIFTAAATTIATMLPVFTIQNLKGFAFTTIVGVLIGVLITRPAYAKIIEELTK